MAAERVTGSCNNLNNVGVVLHCLMRETRNNLRLSVVSFTLSRKIVVGLQWLHERE